MLKIIVEGELDAQIVRGLLARTLRNPIFEIKVWSGSLDPQRAMPAVYDFAGRSPAPVLVVYDQESGTIADRPLDREFGGEIKWCPAIPQIEAWLFADEKTLKEFIPESTFKVLSRLPSPESIPYPKVLRNYMLKDRSISELMERIDLQRAALRCPSLAYFMKSSQELNDEPVTFDVTEIPSNQLNRQVVNSLISEVYPGSSTIFRTSSGDPFTASQMLMEVERGSAIGREYATAILRVARDLLRRQAERSRDL